MRGNFNYIIKTISIIDETVNEQTDVNTLIELFSQGFFDSLIIPEPGEDDLLMLCYLLLQKEIYYMNSASVSSFLDENNTFVGKFIKSYTKKHELSTYLSMTLGSLILSIKNSIDNCFELNPKSLYSTIKKKAKSNCNTNTSSINSSFITNISHEDYLNEDIPKNSIKRNNEYTIINGMDDIISFNDTYVTDKASSSKLLLQSKTILSDQNTPVNKNNINHNYLIDINQDKLTDLIQAEKDPNLRDFYLKQFQRINGDPDIFTNKKL